MGKCHRCGEELVSKSGFCQECLKKIFSGAKKPVFFCKKCKSYDKLKPTELARALKEAGVKPQTLKNWLVVLYLESCRYCYEQGDSKDAQFARLAPIPKA